MAVTVGRSLQLLVAEERSSSKCSRLCSNSRAVRVGASFRLENGSDWLEHVLVAILVPALYNMYYQEYIYWMKQSCACVLYLSKFIGLCLLYFTVDSPDFNCMRELLRLGDFFCIHIGDFLSGV